MSNRDAFGFQFWLGWILWFAGSLLLAAIFWTVAMTFLFGRIQEPEVVCTWAIAVFGSWFILLTPFMRKKEQIWKRLNTDEEKAVDAWLSGLGLFIGLLLVTCVFWTWKLRALVTDNGRFDTVWLKRVIGTWLLLLLPFLVLLYRKADRIFKEAVIRQSEIKSRFRSIFIERAKRILPDTVSESLKKIPETLDKGHVVTLLLKDGRKIENAFVLNSKEILGLYDADEINFEAQEVMEARAVEKIPVYEESKWLRLDGRI